MRKNKMFKNVMFLGLAATAGLSLASCKKTEDNTNKYTYNSAYDGEILNWSPANWQTNADSIIYGYTGDGLYTFDFNDDKTSYKYDLAMASALPEDVSASYAGKFQVPAGTTDGAGYAYRIKLNQDCKFQDGKAINADSYIESYKRLIDTKTNNYRATTYESGQLVISGSAYYKNKDNGTEKVTIGDYCKYTHDKQTQTTADAVAAYFEEHKSDKAVVNWAKVGYVFSASAQEGFAFDSDSGYYYREAGNADNADVESEFTLEQFDDVCKKALGSTFDAYALVDYTFDSSVTFENSVGLQKIDNYTIDIVSDVAISQFYMIYNLSSTWLLDTELYDKCKTDIGNGKYESTYGTSVETTNSYGPYKLTEYKDNKQFRLEKNENWYGYSKKENEGYYKTTDIFYQRIDSADTRLQMFLKGELDDTALDATTVKEYVNSDNLQVTPETFTMEFFMNSNKDKLKKTDTEGSTKNSVLFAYDDFRKGLSLSINRESFASTVSAGCEASAMLFNNLYISDPDNGTVYRSTEQAKQAFKDAYAGATTVAGTYNPSAAQNLFKSVYDAAVAAGDYTSDAEIKIIVATSTTTAEYQAVRDYLETSLNTILTQTNNQKGTNYGKVTVELNGADGSKRYANLLAGKYTMMFGSWGGNSLAPHNFIQVFLDPSYNYCPGFDTKGMQFTATIHDGDNGATNEYTMSYYDWYKNLNEGKWAAASADVRNEVLAAIEANFLQEYTIIPMYALSDFNLVSKKVKYPVDEYVTVMGFGGIKYLDYKYSDAEWATYVKENSNNGNLDYNE